LNVRFGSKAYVRVAPQLCPLCPGFGAGVGKTKVVTAQGISDSKNDIMLYSLVEAETHEAAAESFEGHPHLQIPQSSIEIMEVHALPGMK
jgi:hypothetical protein